jgi:ubiquinone/menaquinone biosynthesis C-methylase UbiE
MTATTCESKSGQDRQTSNYTQGHSDYTIATHESRTAESDAAFLLPFIKKTDHILDAGCGPGTITTSFANYASEGTITGIDMSEEVLERAKKLATEAKVPFDGLGSVIFEHGNVLEGLFYPDNTFDIVYCSQLFGHLPSPDLSCRALAELRRVLKSGGILATRDGVAQHFYPQSLELDRLWVRNQARGLNKGPPPVDPTGTIMPALFRSVGFDVDGGRVLVGAGTKVYAGAETRNWLAWRAVGQLQEGDAFRQSWLEAGITEKEIQQTMRAVKEWAETDDAWYAALQCEMLAWK